ncbi:hypothetical protein CVT24_004597 [Panaeolus cyanescens]|uniref:F-box domain-containing protein n=1 Tax=Panaeolus cyanescens TaxID=181874 RepID=A0A409YBC6_9AGAR|nr:hypothetical protein CVT24_004597 [Panaeolus cyanescens]
MNIHEPIPSFPPELVSQIINISASSKTLDHVKNLSLVSSFFRDECRKHVFRKITIGNDDGGTDDYEDGFDDSDQPTTETMPWISNFINLIRLHPHVIPYIQELDIVHPCSDEQELYRLAKALKKHVFPKLSVCTLRFHGDTGDSEDHCKGVSSFFRVVPSMPALRQLNLQHVDPVPPSILASCNQLEGLSLINVVFGGVTKAFNPTAPPPTLKSLHLEFSDYYCFELDPFTRLQRMDGAPIVNLSNLARLHLHIGGIRDVKAFSRLLESQTNKVQSIETLALTIDMTDPDHYGYYSTGYIPSNIPKQIEGWVLPNFRALTTLHIFYICVEKTIDLYYGLSGILASLETNNILGDLKLQLELRGGCRDNAGESWKRLVDVLMKPGWAHLKEVMFVFDMPHLRAEREIFNPLGSQKNFNFRVEFRKIYEM